MAMATAREETATFHEQQLPGSSLAGSKRSIYQDDSITDKRLADFNDK